MLLNTAESAAAPQATKKSPQEIYESRSVNVDRTVELLRQSERRFVRIRVAIFLVAVCLAIICLGDGRLSLWFLSLPAIGFLILLPMHSKCVDQLSRWTRVRQFYRECLDRMQHRWSDRVHDGKTFADSGHAWSLDLDLFGPGSLFQMISECRTAPGRRFLADWMTTVPTCEQIRVRQTRAEALRENVTFREQLSVIPDSVEWQKTDRMLRDWVTGPASRIPVWILVGSGFIGFLAVPTVLATIPGIVPGTAILALIVLQAPFILLTRRQIQQVFSSIDSADHALQQLAELLVILESQTFAEPSLIELQSQLRSAGRPASELIRTLSSRTRWLNHSLRNQFFAPIAWMGGLIVHLTDRLEQWRQAHGAEVSRWLNTAAEFEALLSVAAFRFEHPDYCNPIVSDTVPIYEAVQLGHPLLERSACVRNDVSLTAAVPLMLISGSNMSGKSTLLRAVGANLVLTFCGAVVNAEKLTTYPFQPATAMRISDSLQEGRSLFFSVVQRLRTIVELTKEPRTVLFLLDEILHGTNSHDRRRGAEGVIRSLIRQGALGMVTTHDLALTQIVDSMDGRGINCHFEDVVHEGKMTFDYRLREGVVQRSNALELMRMMGLDV